MRRTVWFVSLGLAVVTAAGCQSIGEKLIQEPKVSLSTVGIKDINTNGATLLVGVRVENPNPFRIRVDSLKYNVDLDGKRLSSSELPDIAVIDGHAMKVIDIPVPVQFQDLFASAMDFITKKKSKYRLSGEARFGVLKIPFDQTGELNLR